MPCVIMAPRKKILAWIAVPDDIAQRAVTWHATSFPLQLDGMSGITGPERIPARCGHEVPRHSVTRTSLLRPEPAYPDHLCGRCLYPDLRVPPGWRLEPLPRQPDLLLLSSPPPRSGQATIDFRARGVRTGYSTSGRFLHETWDKRRVRPGGLGWRQVLVEDAVAHLQGESQMAERA